LEDTHFIEFAGVELGYTSKFALVILLVLHFAIIPLPFTIIYTALWEWIGA
jgi:hypothetical protein